MYHSYKNIQFWGANRNCLHYRNMKSLIATHQHDKHETVNKYLPRYPDCELIVLPTHNDQTITNTQSQFPQADVMGHFLPPRSH